MSKRARRSSPAVNVNILPSSWVAVHVLNGGGCMELAFPDVIESMRQTLSEVTPNDDIKSLKAPLWTQRADHRVVLAQALLHPESPFRSSETVPQGYKELYTREQGDLVELAYKLQCEKEQWRQNRVYTFLRISVPLYVIPNGRPAKLYGSFRVQDNIIVLIDAHGVEEEYRLEVWSHTLEATGLTGKEDIPLNHIRGWKKFVTPKRGLIQVIKGTVSQAPNPVRNFVQNRNYDRNLWSLVKTFL